MRYTRPKTCLTSAAVRYIHIPSIGAERSCAPRRVDRRRSFQSRLGDSDASGSQQPIVDHVAVLQNADDGIVTLRVVSAPCQRLKSCQAAATAVRHVSIAAARSVRCVWAEERWRWTLKVL